MDYQVRVWKVYNYKYKALKHYTPAQSLIHHLKEGYRDWQNACDCGNNYPDIFELEVTDNYIAVGIVTNTEHLVDEYIEDNPFNIKEIRCTDKFKYGGFNNHYSVRQTARNIWNYWRTRS